MGSVKQGASSNFLGHVTLTFADIITKLSRCRATFCEPRYLNYTVCCLLLIRCAMPWMDNYNVRFEDKEGRLEFYSYGKSMVHLSDYTQCTQNTTSLIGPLCLLYGCIVPVCTRT